MERRHMPGEGPREALFNSLASVGESAMGICREKAST